MYRWYLRDAGMVGDPREHQWCGVHRDAVEGLRDTHRRVSRPAHRDDHADRLAPEPRTGRPPQAPPALRARLEDILLPERPLPLAPLILAEVDGCDVPLRAPNVSPAPSWTGHPRNPSRPEWWQRILTWSQKRSPPPLLDRVERPHGKNPLTGFDHDPSAGG